MLLVCCMKAADSLVIAGSSLDATKRATYMAHNGRGLVLLLVQHSIGVTSNSTEALPRYPLSCVPSRPQERFEGQTGQALLGVWP